MFMKTMGSCPSDKNSETGTSPWRTHRRPETNTDGEKLQGKKEKNVRKTRETNRSRPQYDVIGLPIFNVKEEKYEEPRLFLFRLDCSIKALQY